MTREELKEHCERQIQQFERVEKLMPVTLNDWKRYEEHKLILELLEQEPKIKVLNRDEAMRKLGAVDIYQASAWIKLLDDLEYLGLKICEVEE